MHDKQTTQNEAALRCGHKKAVNWFHFALAAVSLHYNLVIMGTISGVECVLFRFVQRASRPFAATYAPDRRFSVDETATERRWQ